MFTQKTFADYVRQQSRSNSTSLPDATLLVDVNAELITYASLINEADEDILGTDATVDIEATVTNGWNREFIFPTDVLGKITKVEAKLDGTNWIWLNELDLNTYSRTSDEATIISQFANSQGLAFYDIWRKAIVLYTGTLIDVTAGLRLWYQGKIAPLDDLTEDTRDISIPPATTGANSYKHGIPEELHELLARHAIIQYKQRADVQMALTESEKNYKVDRYDAIRRMKKANMDRKTFMKPESMEANGDYGYDY